VRISYCGDSIIPGKQVLAMFHDHDAHAMKVGNLDDLIDNAFCREEFRATKRATRFFQRQVVVGFADVTFLPKVFSDDKLSDQERVENFDHPGKAKNQLVSRFVLGQLSNRRCFSRGFIVGQRGFDEFFAIAGVGGR